MIRYVGKRRRLAKPLFKVVKILPTENPRIIQAIGLMLVEKYRIKIVTLSREEYSIVENKKDVG